MTERAAEICKQLDSKKKIRALIEPVWRDCFSVAYPLLAHGLSGEQVDASSNQNALAKILDGVTADSVRVLAAHIMSGMVPANSRWFGLDVNGRETGEEKRWLEGAAVALWENIHASNFDSEAYEAVIAMICSGQFALYIDEDKERGGYVFEQWPLGSVYVSASKAGGRIDTVYREFELRAEAAFNLYGTELSEHSQKLAKEKPDENIRFVRVIQPRANRKKAARLAKDMAYSSETVEVGKKKIVAESGYHELPVVCPRWFKLPSSDWAVGPLSEALPDANMLQKLKQMHLANAEMTIAGMWVAEDDGVLNPRTMKLGPRKVIIANSTDSIKPLQPSGNWQLAMEEIKNTQAAIRKILMADALPPADGPAKTAYEYSVRLNMLRQMLGPVFGRMQTEWLQVMLERCFGIAYRASVFTEPPESLRGKPFTIKYISPLSRAQKLDDAAAIERLYATASQMIAVDPEVADMLDAQEAVRILRESYGAPATVLRDDEAVAERREQRMQAQQQAMMAQTMGGMAERAAPQLAKTMMGEGNAATG